jgi:hypothetical protein
MRTPNLGSVAYTPDDPPADPAQLQRFLRDELRKISAAIQLLALGHIDKTHVAPAKPRDGYIRLADGTNWNPGSGQGVYVYYGAAWHFLG